MAHPSYPAVWETWESVFLKTTSLGNMIIERSLARGERITRIAFVPRGGLYLANILSRMLGLSGDQAISLGVSRFNREHPRQAGDSRSASYPTSPTFGQVVLLVDEVHDTGRRLNGPAVESRRCCRADGRHPLQARR
jgi:hypoxanthine phosphoribosyltransferase